MFNLPIRSTRFYEKANMILVFLFLLHYFLPYIWFPGVGFTRFRYDMLVLPVAAIIFLVQWRCGNFSWKQTTPVLKIIFLCNLGLALWLLARINTDLFLRSIPHPIRGFVTPFTIFGNYGCVPIGAMLVFLVLGRWLIKNRMKLLVSFLLLSVLFNLIGLFIRFYPDHNFSHIIYAAFGGIKQDVYGVSRYPQWQAAVSAAEFITKKSGRVCSIFPACTAYAFYCSVVAGTSIICFDKRFADLLKTMWLRLLASLTFVLAILGGILTSSKSFSLGIYCVLFCIIVFSRTRRMRIGVCCVAVLLFIVWPFLCKIDMAGGHRNNLVLNRLFYRTIGSAYNSITRASSQKPSLLICFEEPEDSAKETTEQDDTSLPISDSDIHVFGSRYGTKGFIIESYRTIWKEGSLFFGKGARTGVHVADGAIHTTIGFGGIVALLLTFLPPLILIGLSWRENIRGNPFAFIVLALQLLSLSLSFSSPIYQTGRLSMPIYLISLVFLGDSLLCNHTQDRSCPTVTRNRNNEGAESQAGEKSGGGPDKTCP